MATALLPALLLLLLLRGDGGLASPDAQKQLPLTVQLSLPQPLATRGAASVQLTGRQALQVGGGGGVAAARPPAQWSSQGRSAAKEAGIQPVIALPTPSRTQLVFSRPVIRLGGDFGRPGAWFGGGKVRR